MVFLYTGQFARCKDVKDLIGSVMDKFLGKINRRSLQPCENKNSRNNDGRAVVDSGQLLNQLILKSFSGLYQHCHRQYNTFIHLMMQKLSLVEYFQKVFKIKPGVREDFLMSGIRVCATPIRVDHCFASKIQNRPQILKFFSRAGSFLRFLSLTSKIPVAFLKNDRSDPNFLSRKYAYLLAKDAECMPVKIIVSK